MFDWISLILSVVALAISIVTLPSVFQMFWGGPKIQLECTQDEDIENGLRWLRCHIYNRPIQNRMLSALKVHRTPADDVFARVEVREEATNRLIGSFVPDIDVINYEHKARVRIPASIFPAQFPVVMFFRSDQKACIAAEPNNAETLPPGEYRVIVNVHVGEELFFAEWLLVVGKSAEGTFWGRSLPARR